MIDYYQFTMRLIKDKINDVITTDYYVGEIEIQETELIVRIKSSNSPFRFNDKVIKQISDIVDVYTPFVRDELKTRGSTKHGGVLTFVLCEETLKRSFSEIQSSEQQVEE